MMRSAVQALRREETSSATGENYGLLGLLLAGIRHFERGVQDLGQADAIQRESHAPGSISASQENKGLYLSLALFRPDDPGYRRGAAHVPGKCRDLRKRA